MKAYSIVALLDIGLHGATVMLVRLNIALHSFKLIGKKRYKFPNGLSGELAVDVKISLSVQNLHEAEIEFGAIASEAIIALGSRYIDSLEMEVRISTDVNYQKNITNKHISKLKKALIVKHESILPHNVIIDTVAGGYILDGGLKLSNPLDVVAHNSIALKSYVFSIKSVVLTTISRELQNFRIISRGYVPAILSAAYCCFFGGKIQQSEDTLLINYGASEISFACIGESFSWKYSGFILSGGFDITRKIASHYSLSLEDAEQLKILKGSTHSIIPNSAVGAIDFHINYQGVEGNELSNIIASEIADKLAQIQEMLKKDVSNVYKNLSNIIITGGVAGTAGIENLIQKIFGIPCNIGATEMQLGENLDIRDRAKYSVTCGLAEYVLRNKDFSSIASPNNNIKNKLSGFFTNMANLLNEFLN